jgi:hypothetical protein
MPWRFASLAGSSTLSGFGHPLKATLLSPWEDTMAKTIEAPAPRQLVMEMEPALDGLEGTERALAVSLLAQLLLEATGLVVEEDSNEDV